MQGREGDEQKGKKWGRVDGGEKNRKKKGNEAGWDGTSKRGGRGGKRQSIWGSFFLDGS